MYGKVEHADHADAYKRAYCNDRFWPTSARYGLVSNSLIPASRGRRNQTTRRLPLSNASRRPVAVTWISKTVPGSYTARRSAHNASILSFGGRLEYLDESGCGR